MHFIIIFLFITAASAAPTDSLRYETYGKTSPLEQNSDIDEDENESINPLEEGEDSISAKRHKKSATTTFCVEVRPSDPYEKPYELCEYGNHIYTMPIENESNYKVPGNVFGVPMSSSASHPFKKPTYAAPKPSTSFSSSNAAAFSSSSKTEASYPKGGRYRSNDDSQEDVNNSEELGMEMEDGNEDMMHIHPLMRAAGYGYGAGYGHGGGPSYGGGGPEYGMSYIKFKGAGKDKKGKGMGDNHGLVITCQPNLAGYASAIGGGFSGGGDASGFHSPGSYMNYRSSSGRSPSKYRSKYYGPDSLGFGGSGGNAFGSKSGSGISKSTYGGSSLPFNSDAYYSPTNFNRGPLTPFDNSPSSNSASSFIPGPVYTSSGSHVSHGGGGYSPPVQYQSGPSYGNPHVPVYNIPQYPNSQAPFHGYNPVPSGLSSSSTSSSASYVPPGTYRSGENSADSSMMMKVPMDAKEKEMDRTVTIARQDEKDKHTMENMHKMTHPRPPSMWNGNMRTSSNQSENMQKEIKAEHSDGGSMTDTQQTKT